MLNRQTEIMDAKNVNVFIVADRKFSDLSEVWNGEDLYVLGHVPVSIKIKEMSVGPGASYEYVNEGKISRSIIAGLYNSIVGWIFKFRPRKVCDLSVAKMGFLKDPKARNASSFRHAVDGLGQFLSDLKEDLENVFINKIKDYLNADTEAIEYIRNRLCMMDNMCVSELVTLNVENGYVCKWKASTQADGKAKRGMRLSPEQAGCLLLDEISVGIGPFRGLKFKRTFRVPFSERMKAAGHMATDRCELGPVDKAGAPRQCVSI